MTVLLNKPKCQYPNCESEAISRYGNRWVCGVHITKIAEKIQKMKEEIFFTEDGN